MGTGDPATGNPPQQDVFLGLSSSGRFPLFIPGYSGIILHVEFKDLSLC